MKRDLIPVTVRIPKKDLSRLLRAHPEVETQSELIRKLLEDELERLKSWAVHKAMVGKLTSDDIE